MSTLRDKLLDGKVIGETFNIYNPELLGEDPVENYHYVVRDLRLGEGCMYDKVMLAADGEDHARHEFLLSYRLGDKLVERQKEQKPQKGHLEGLTPEQIERISCGCSHQF